MEEKIEKTENVKTKETSTGNPRPASNAGYRGAPRGDRPQRSGDRPQRGGDRQNRSGGRQGRFGKKNFFFKKRVCFFCKNKEAVLDYKDVGLMKRFVAESGKISPRRFTGTCAKHQRKLAVEIKKARQMALLPYTDKHK
ncbi:MAG: 30S ribosomal protein S18 [Candidatus Heimdallarchaeota archaeon]|nr:30S ribosomal protein S18 [Candidatus Heimdallarchaeota archaeon]